VLRAIKIVLLLISLLLFAFAVVSGAEGNDVSSILRNSPNAWPWLILLLLNYWAWKKPLIAGVLITIFGLFSIYFFNFTGSSFYPIVFFVTVLITLLGVSLLFLTKKEVSK
jgi:hypothetical protein